MNVLHWLECWWYKRHAPVAVFAPGYKVLCARCGVVLGEKR